MPRLIDADALADELAVLLERNRKLIDEWLANLIEDAVDDAPTVDAEHVKHGHWINHFDDLFPEESTQECSVCHAEQMGTMLNDNYCPNCGAKMDEEGKDA